MLLYAWEKSGYDAKDGVIQFDNVSTIDFLISSEDYQYPECQESSTWNLLITQDLSVRHVALPYELSIIMNK